MNPERLDHLIHAHLDETLDAAGRAELEAELLASAAARRRFWALAEVHGLAGDAARVAWGEAERPRRSYLARWWLPLAAAIVLAAGLRFLWRPAAVAGPEASASGFAVVTSQADAVWRGGKAPATGDLLAGEPLRLESGAVRFDLFSGVTAVVEGPAEFRIVSPMEVRVVAGKLRARVPEAAQGFRVRTALGDVVDLGTEFAVEATAERSELHVIEGAVEWHPLRAAMRRLESGDGLRWSADGAALAMAEGGNAFVGPEELALRAAAHHADRQQAWQVFSEKLRRDPRLVLYYTMEPPAGETEPALPDRAAAAGHKPVPGAIVAAARDTDRWGRARGALDFSRAGARVRLAVPGEFRSLTLLCWVKINSLDRRFNSLFLTDGFDLDEPHWQLHDTHRLVFVRSGGAPDTGSGRNDRYLSPPIWNVAQTGKWMMLATVYDADGAMVTHYVDGRPVSQEPIPAEVRDRPMVIGAASLGNWNLAYRDDPTFAIRNLNGSMDEFALFGAALAPAEIAGIYEHGKP
jgi:hypothetical protein